MPLWITAGSAVIGGAMNLWGNNKAAKERAKEAELIEQNKKDQTKLITDEYGALIGKNNQNLSNTENEYTIESNKNYLDRSDAQNVLAKVREQNNKAVARSENMGAITGASEEAALAQKADIAENTGDVIQGLAAGADAHKDQLKEQRDAKQRFYDNISSNLTQNKVSSLNSVYGNYTAAKAGLLEQNAAGQAKQAADIGSIFTTAGAIGGDYAAENGVKLFGKQAADGSDYAKMTGSTEIKL